ncbi:Sec-independent protein translocase subunit TatA [Streptomyces otsuchiensis]|uniref:Sec-independent protein translocase subunit TatA n=1 Tax=Streptomyces otsuchiensis TaxID=2681388 RepID=UPI0010324E4E|nr:Sec-independent protein translocase subunit TatA [Streptomyces otsuchiensis]
MGQIGTWQIVIILVLLVVIFGSKKLPDAARGLGKSLRILKSETAALRKDGDTDSTTTQAAAPEQTPAQQQPAARTIQAAPGDVSSARPVEEPRGNAQG